jgi:ABC-type cobalamin/Fe3+-siderophores transport system ATPase subunit
MEGNNAAAKSKPLIALRRLRIKDFRRIEQLDVELPDTVRVICLVGPNGSGKSSLLTKLADALCQHTREPAPDLPKGVGAKPYRDGWVRYSSTGEVRAGQPAYLIRSDWELHGQPGAHTDFVLRSWEGQVPPDYFPDGGGISGVPPGKLFLNQWHPHPHGDDPIARGVLLVRPADRWEKASYEESDEVVVTPPFSTNWINKRPFPIKVRSWGYELEQFLYSMFVEDILKRPLPTAASILFDQVYTALIGTRPEFTVRPWPFVRVGPQANPQLSSLSAGELDILVTAGLIIAQAVALAMKTGKTELNPEGFVFIDEIDSHLHPQWQQKVMPILTAHFPNVTFVITTHSPFVLRSLSKEVSRVIRLPDGEVFNTEFSAWQIDDILGAVFEVPSPWSQGISGQLEDLEELLRAPGREVDALKLYNELVSHQSTGLKAECRRLAGLFGSAAFTEMLLRSEDAALGDVDENVAPAETPA